MSLKGFTCEVCGKTFSVNSNLKRHIRFIHPISDNIELFQCEICTKIFKAQSSLNIHIKTVHSTTHILICEICGKGFNLRCNLDTHIKTIHLKNECFSCAICGKSFNIRSNLNRHVKAIHLSNECERFTCEMCAKSFNVRSNLEIHIKTIHSSDRFSCEVCAKTFQTNFKLYSHMRKFHSKTTTRKKKIKCKLCEGVFSVNEFAHHFPQVHNIELKTEQNEFKCEYDFLEWKKSVEEQEIASYVKTCGSSSSKLFQKIVYYNCHRSGYYRGKFESQRQRAIKKQGTSKINSYCPAKIKARVNHDGSVNVTHCSTHVGHKMELAHLNIPSDDRKELASKIIAKVPFDSIIEDVQTSGINIQRTHLIKKQDLRNIIRDFSLGNEYMPKKKSKKHPSEKNTKMGKQKNVESGELHITGSSEELHLETLKKRVSDECNLILSKVTSNKQMHVLLTNFQSFKTVLDSSELDVGNTEVRSTEATNHKSNVKREMEPQNCM